VCMAVADNQHLNLSFKEKHPACKVVVAILEMLKWGTGVA